MLTAVALLLFAACAGVYGWLHADRSPGIRRAAYALVAFVMLAIATAGMATAQEFRVINGYSFEVFDERQSETIRLWGIDVPEFSGGCVEYARDAREVLELLLQKGSLRCGQPPDGQERDRYGRLVRICIVGEDDEDLARMMVSVGFAWDWPRYSDGVYDVQQFAARLVGLGVWEDDTCRPRWWEE